jgi:hypothetical protein
VDRKHVLQQSLALNKQTKVWRAFQQSVPLAGVNASCVSQDALERGLAVTFRNEEGQGASLFLERGLLNARLHAGPGVMREWFKVVCDQLFNPDYALWKPLPTNPRAFPRVLPRSCCSRFPFAGLFAPNPDSHLNSSHLDYFRFSGAPCL